MCLASTAILISNIAQVQNCGICTSTMCTDTSSLLISKLSAAQSISVHIGDQKRKTVTRGVALKPCISTSTIGYSSLGVALEFYVRHSDFYLIGLDE